MVALLLLLFSRPLSNNKMASPYSFPVSPFISKKGTFGAWQDVVWLHREEKINNWQRGRVLVLTSMRDGGDGARGLACAAAVLAESCWGVPASWCQAQGRVLVHGKARWMLAIVGLKHAGSGW